MPVGINETDQATFNLIWSKLNQDLTNIVQKFKAATAPTSTEPLMWWFDTVSSILKLRNEADDAWIEMFYVDGSDNLYTVGPFRVSQNSDTITLSHDGTDVTFAWSDGELILQTDEGTNADTVVALKGKGTGKGIVELWDQSASHKLALQPPDSLSADVTYTWPTADGSDGHALTTNGSGTMSWAQSGGGDGTPAGNISMCGGSSAPTGWLLCDGSAVSRTTYADLFTAIGTTWGVGDGSTTFNLPDLRSRSPIGAGQGSGLSNRTLASTGGAETHTLTASQMPAHSHNYDKYGTTGTVLDDWQNGSKGFSSNPTSSAGSGAAHNNMHPRASVTFIIKT